MQDAASVTGGAATLARMTTTPRELEDELDVSAKTIRACLREQYPDHEHGARWELDEEQATVVRARFSD
ncbi:hypothetical protein LSHI6S_00022 [Leifsonia shinshuensis]